MANFVIHPVPLFLMDRDKSIFTYHYGVGQRIIVVGYVWYIEGTKERILVDAGGDTEYMWNARQLSARDIQTVDSGLSKLGVSPTDIDLVILTHLHQDHVAQAFRFTKARFLIQRDELEFARNPHPSLALPFHKEFFDGLNFEVISGDAKITEGISVIKTAGHSPGGQSVGIKTAKGVVVISGLCTIADNFEPPPSVGLPVLTPGAHTNIPEAYDSLLKIKEMADIVVPLHDPKFQHICSIP